MSTARSIRANTSSIVGAVIVVILVAGGLPVLAADSGVIQFSISEQRADRALMSFAQQAGLSVLFPYDKVSTLKANRLVGAYEVQQGLELLLADTGLQATLTDGQRLTIRLAETEGAQAPEAETGGILTSMLRAIGNTLRSAPASPAAEETEPALTRMEEVIVTGSRIRRDDFSSAQPTTVIGSEMLEALNISNTGDAMSLVPSNLGNWTPTAKPGGNESYPLNVFNGLNLANLRGLNPVYGSRTLTLVDSRRHMPTNQGDGVDLNMIPSILIDRMEVVTGGASASYGSGAIGGVVNVILDDDFDGSRAQIGLGSTELGDGRDEYYGFAWGSPLDNGGHLVLALEMQELDPIENCIETRDWCARGGSVRVNPDYRDTPGENFLYRENVRFNMSKRGVFVGLGREFNEDGSATVPYRRTDMLGLGGDGQHIYLDTSLRTNVDRRVAFARYEQPLAGDMNFSVEASVGKVESWTPQDSIDLFVTRLRPDNYYLNRLADSPCAGAWESCLINKDFSAQAGTANETDTDLRRIGFGFDGRFGVSSWTWDAYYQYGNSEALQAVHNSRHSQRMQFAIDAVDDGTGNPVCRVTRDGIGDFTGNPRLAEGCVPLNIFGTRPIEAGAFAYSWGRILENTEVRQNMFELVASGEVMEGFGERPFRSALGFSWRDESLENIADTLQPDYIRNDYNSQFGESFGGTVEVLEYFAELELPLSDRLALQLAARRSHYQNTAGIGTQVEGRKFNYDIDTWKINGHWELSDWLTLRASRSRDVRAPNFRDLYYGKVFPLGSNFGYCGNPWTGNDFQGWYTFTGDPCRAELRGGIDLKPEKADTTTYGMVLQPFSPGTRLAIDYFGIEIHDAISPASWFYTIDQCYQNRDPEFCGLIQGELLDPDDPLGGFAKLDVVSSKALNQYVYEMHGIDVAADWVKDLGAGTLSMRLMATHMIEQLIQPDVTSTQLQDIAGVSGLPEGGRDWVAAPDWSGQWFTSYELGPFSATLQARYVSEGIKDAEYVGPGQTGYDPNAENSIDDNHVSSYVVWGLSGAYRFTLRDLRFQLFGNVQNLFDREPPLIGTGIGGTNPVLFDTIGRRYQIGLRVSF